MKRGSATNRYLDFVVGVPVLNLLACFRGRRAFPANPRRIGILFNPAIGDTLLASAAIADLRASFAKSTFVALVAATNAPAARLLPDIDKIELLQFSNPLASIRAIRRCGLDIIFDLSAWQRITALYSFFSGARYTAGFERARQYRHRGYDQTVPHRSDCHELENLRRFAHKFGSQPVHDPRWVVPAGPVPSELAHVGRLVIFHAWASGSGSTLREWPDEYWVELAHRLTSPGRVFVLTGSPSEEARCDSLLQMLLSGGLCAKVLIGRGGLENIARVVQRAELVVSVNTGIMHLAAILGAPTVALNGPTAVHRWGAVGPRVTNLSPPSGEGGFLDLGFEYGRNRTSVMPKITVDQVVRAIDELLSRTNKPQLATFETQTRTLPSQRMVAGPKQFAAELPQHNSTM